MFKRKAFFLPTDNGHLFCLHYLPDNEAISNTLFFPPFTEELNRSRHLISLMAAQLAENGHTVLIVDLYGTGDSEGNFIDATWMLWKQDMQHAIDFLQQQNTLPINFFSIRLGALLALDLLTGQSNNSQQFKINKFIAWQPVFNTKKNIQQFLRLQLANSLHKEAQYKTTIEIQQQIINSGAMEIAGYTFSAKLMNDILSLSDLKTQTNNIPANLQFSFFQITSGSASNFSRDIQTFLLKYPQIQDKIDTQLVQASPFWQVYDTKDISELRDLSCNALSDTVSIHP